MKLHKAVLVVALLASIGIVGFLLPVRAWFAEFEAYVHSLGAIGPAIYALGYVVLTVLLFPASFVTLGAGTLFGLKTGLFVALAGANLGALCSFLLARTFLRQKVMLWTAPYPKFRFLDEAIGKQGFKMVLLCRLSPIFPFILLNYFLGLTAVRTAAYVMANMLGMLPAMFLFVYIGATARAALEVQPTATDFYQEILKYLGLAATVLLLVVVTRIARKALREAEQALEGGGVDKAHIDENHEPTPFDKMVSVEDPRDQQLIQNCRPPGWINPVPAKKYNLVVIGGGTAGLVSAAGAAGLGARVALIERNLLGGDCLNVGCVPSKGIIRAARAAGDARGGGEFGITPPGEAEINFSAVMERMRRLRADISAHDSVERFTQLGVDVFIGNGRFVGPNRIEVADQELKFDRAVIASGARAAEPPISGLRDAGFYTNETIFTLTALPRRLAVIGAGPLGCELAQCFQ
ncbi:MAG TPA: FAD-dependent oxidoreductase, partial [Candidatus Limnocylindrales bacterium]|nr:FAD-dependent oxidoreductase [Candidatus Limnocylindrales bacterium]